MISCLSLFAFAILTPMDSRSVATPPPAERHATARVGPATAGLPFEKIAKDFASARGIDVSKPESLTLEDVLAKHFVTARLGLFDVRFPLTALEKHAGRWQSTAAALVAAQDKWLDWLQAAGGDQKALRDDLKLLAAWIKGWKPAVVARGKDQGTTDVFKMLAAPEAVVAAAARLADAFGRGVEVGPARDTPRSVRLIVAPTRKDFTEIVCFTGLVVPDQRATYWVENAPDWTQAFILGDQMIALEYAIASRPAADYTSGTSMDEILDQQVAQLAMNSLFADHYGERVPGAFIGGLSMNLVVDLYGQVNTRVDGDTRSKVTGKREVFVPGGQSEGGMLPKNSAETKWRENGGKDHFVPTLRAAQKDALELARDLKNKQACFAIRSDAGGEKWAACAPFLGSVAASGKPPPPAFAPDFAEFIRAYKSAFIFWLQTKSQSSERASREHFATLLRKLADPNQQSDFEAIFKTVYDGAPLSAPEADKDSLEGKFLSWLAKQK